MSDKTGRTGSRRRGNNLIEFTFLLPWYIFLFAGVFNFGFYVYALIAVQNAARIGALYCSANVSSSTDSSTACTYALDQVRYLPNVSSSLTTCGSSPLVVTASLVTGPDSNNATSVTVTYSSPQLIPIPGILPGSLTVRRTVVMVLQG